MNRALFIVASLFLVLSCNTYKGGSSIKEKSGGGFSFLANEYTSYGIGNLSASDGSIGPYLNSGFYSNVPYPMIWLHDSTRVRIACDTFQFKFGHPSRVVNSSPTWVWSPTADGTGRTFRVDSLQVLWDKILGKPSSFSSPMKIPVAMTAKTIGTAYTISNTLDHEILVSASISCNLSLTGGQAGSLILEISPNGSTGWIYQGTIPNSNTGTLTVGLNTTQVGGGQLKAWLPRTYWWRLRSVNTTGTPTFTWIGGSQLEK